MSNFSNISDDILYNIMSRLSAKPFAAAACVSHLWNRISDLILSRPQFSSGLSLAVSPEIAVNEALEMALSKPIRPHFAIAFIGLRFPIEKVHEQITNMIGPDAILITSASVGIIGVDSNTRELEEVKWERNDENVSDDNIYLGISVVIGFVPGLKINVVPLLHTNTEPEVAMVGKFLSDIKKFTVSASGDTNPDPVGMMVFGDLVARTMGEVVIPVYASGLISSFPELIDDEYYSMYIGVDKQIILKEGGMPIQYQEFYEIINILESMFIVAGRCIRPGDICKLYHSDKKHSSGME